MVPDSVEESQGSDPNDISDYLDSDGDGVPDYVEIMDGTDPFDPNDFLDLDNDQVPDYIEIIIGQDVQSICDGGLEDYYSVAIQYGMCQIVTVMVCLIWKS